MQDNNNFNNPEKTNSEPQTNVNQPLAESRLAPKIPKTQFNRGKLMFVAGLVLAIFAIVGTGAIIVLNKTSKSPFTEPKVPKYQNPTNVPDVSIPSAYPTQATITGVYKNHYGEYKIKLPDGWEAEGCIGAGSPDGCATISPSGAKESVYSTPVITIDAVIPENNVNSSKTVNFNVPALGNNLNATFEKSLDKGSISFLNRGILYTLEGDYNQANQIGYSADKLDEILKNVAASITFLNEPSSCSNPALIPLSDFPNNFVLYNYYDSDGTDPVYSYWPYTNKRDDSQYLKDEAAKNTNRGFMVHYTKDGTAFSDSGPFANTVTGIHPNKTNGGFDNSGTGLWHLNCISTQEDGPGNEMPYHVSEDPGDLFGVQLYGSASNPQALWGVSKWNINLLKSVRSRVYIKRGSLWQAYQATDYFATMPTAYGGKPAIYLYSPDKRQVQVEIHPRGQLTKTDKLYDPTISGWKVLADNNGIVGNTQSYLFYEAVLPVSKPDRGYVVPFSQLFDFSWSYVKELGLTDTEANEFVNFWKSKLPRAPFYFVSNLDQDTISQIYPLKITPTPQTLIRIELYYKPLDRRINVAQPRKLNYPKRVGLTAVEWGAILDQN